MNALKLTGCIALALCAVACAEGPAQQETAAAAAPGMPEPITMALRPDATGGEKLYIENCAMCHAPNGMGTGLLARRMEVSLLEERDDLSKDFVIQAARIGIGNMPAIPRGEVNDLDLQSIADYLAKGTGE